MQFCGVDQRRQCRHKITDRIIADLEQGVRPWLRPWSAEHAAGKITRPLRHNGIPYKGINVIMLWSASVMKGYACPLWLTFKQAQELGGNVRKGERGELVVYGNRITRTETGDNGEETEREIPFLKGYTVFNAEQCEGLPAQYSAKVEAPALPPLARIERAERFFAATGAEIRHGGNRAFYAVGPDYVQMPPFETFVDAESHSATLAHELTHCTQRWPESSWNGSRHQIGIGGRLGSESAPWCSRHRCLRLLAQASGSRVPYPIPSRLASAFGTAGADGFITMPPFSTSTLASG